MSEHWTAAPANEEGSKHKQPLRAPASIEHLFFCLRRALDLSNPFHATVWVGTLATFATFFGCRRLDEATVTILAAFDEKYHVLRSTEYVLLLRLIIEFDFFSVLFRTLRDGTRSASVHIPWTK